MNAQEAKVALDTVITKARVHLYKPIQIAEILHRDRTCKDIDLANLEDYRTPSRKWRDEFCIKFIGRTSTSSARYQDDVFNSNATPPAALVELGKINRDGDGVVEAYIYNLFKQKHSQMNDALRHCREATTDSFNLNSFMELFWSQAGLRRSIDKIFEIIVYSLFDSIAQELGLSVELRMNPEKAGLLNNFRGFGEKILLLEEGATSASCEARFFRLGATNAADRGLDMWSSYGPVVQVKHLTLSDDLAHNIENTITADRIIVVCKSADETVISAIVGQLGWSARIQSIVTLEELSSWYSTAMENYSETLGQSILQTLIEEIEMEFPSEAGTDFGDFMSDRGYDKFDLDSWD